LLDNSSINIQEILETLLKFWMLLTAVTINSSVLLG